ncbi:unnamed protein product [Closterium sp. NIES-54]
MGSTDVGVAANAMSKEAQGYGKDQQMPAGYPDWAAAFQAYYGQAGQPPPGYYPAAAAAPQHHPYMWGQHMMTPYGQPPPYGAPMYPPAAMYPVRAASLHATVFLLGVVLSWIR